MTAAPPTRAAAGRGVRAVLLLTAALPASLAAQTGAAGWRPDERVLVTDFQSVRALARGPRRLFAATAGGLVSWEIGSGRFAPPITSEDGYPDDGAVALAFDRRDGTLWLAAPDGRLLQFDPFARRFVDEFRVPEAIGALVPGDPAGGELFARGRRGWVRIDPFVRDVRPADPAVVRGAVDRDPTLRAKREVLEDPRLRGRAPFLGERGAGGRHPVTDVVPAADPETFWVATDGGFVVEWDRLADTWTPLAFGLLGEGAGALARDGERVWFAARRARQGRYGVSLSDGSLQEWRQWSADSSRTVPGDRVAAILVRAGEVWVGAASGLYRWDAGSDEWSELRGAGLPVGPVLALSEGGAAGDVWVGHEEGVTRVGSGGVALERLPGDRVEALAVADGWMWIGGARGLTGRRLAAPSSIGGEPGPAAGPAALRESVAALATVGDTLFAGLGREVWRRLPGGSWSRVDALGPLGAPVSALGWGEGVLWAGGAEGVVGWDAGSGWIRRYSFAAGDLPTGSRGRRGVFALLPMGPREVWIATPAGALRLRADG